MRFFIHQAEVTILIFVPIQNVMRISDLLLDPSDNTIPLEEIYLSDENRKAINQLLREYKHVSALLEYGLPVDNKIFLFGHTGCGKTTTAKAIAQALNKKILIVDLSTIVSSRLGETAKNMADIFRKTFREKAVLFLDEFDALARMREHEDKDSSEMKRLVNSIIQLIDELPSDALLIAATNHSAAIDTAILRRFQLKLRFDAPDTKNLDDYYDSLLKRFPEEFRKIDRKYNISYAEAKDLTFKQVKAKLIEKLELPEK